MLTQPKVYVRDAGSSLELECHFYADSFNLFDFPVVWHKKQRHPVTSSPHNQNSYHYQQQQQQQQQPMLSSSWSHHQSYHQPLLLQPSRRHRRHGVIDGGDEDVGIDQINLATSGSSDNEEDCQINMMGNLLEPFASAKRYRATFAPDPPRYIFGLSLTGQKTKQSTSRLDRGILFCMSQRGL
jgi:hypothetical protein